MIANERSDARGLKDIEPPMEKKTSKRIFYG
jgi:hypothetical protein